MTMSHVIWMILLKATYVMLFVIAYAGYYHYFHFLPLL